MHVCEGTLTTLPGTRLKFVLKTTEASTPLGDATNSLDTRSLVFPAKTVGKAYSLTEY